MKKTFVFIVAVIGVLFLAEMLLRFFTDESKYQYCDITDAWMPDDIMGWKNKPYYNRQFFSFGQIVRFSTNVDGLRPATAVREKKAGTKRVLLIGGSTVSCRTVPESESLHHYLDSLLNLSNADFEVINAAVDGFSTDQSYLHLHRLISQYRPDFVIYGYGYNDLFANLRKKELGQNKPRFERAPGGHFLKPTEKNHQIEPLGSEYFINKWLPNSALAGLFRPKMYKDAVQKAKEIKPVENVDITIYADMEKHKNKFLLLGFLLSEMNRLCEENDARFLFYAHPDLKATWGAYRKALNVTATTGFCEDTLEKIAQNRNVHFVRMADYFQQNQSRGPFHLLPFNGQCNGKGYRMQAEVLANEIMTPPIE